VEVPIDDDELKELQGNVVVPRAKRRAALNSGLGVVAKATSKNDEKAEDDDDDEQEFI